MDGQRDRARRELAELQACLRAAPLDSGHPAWERARAHLGPGSWIDRHLDGPEPSEGWEAVANRLHWLRTRLCWLLANPQACAVYA